MLIEWWLVLDVIGLRPDFGRTSGTGKTRSPKTVCISLARHRLARYFIRHHAYLDTGIKLGRVISLADTGNKCI